MKVFTEGRIKGPQIGRELKLGGDKYPDLSFPASELLLYLPGNKGRGQRNLEDAVHRGWPPRAQSRTQKGREKSEIRGQKATGPYLIQSGLTIGT